MRASYNISAVQGSHDAWGEKSCRKRRGPAMSQPSFKKVTTYLEAGTWKISERAISLREASASTRLLKRFPIASCSS